MAPEAMGAAVPGGVPFLNGAPGKLANTWGGGNARLRRIWADQGYTGTLIHGVAQEGGLTLEVVYPKFRQLQRYALDVVSDLGYQPGFQVVPKRWIVKRTFSWLGRQRRLSKDYERLASTAEAIIYLVGIRLLLARLSQT